MLTLNIITNYKKGQVNVVFFLINPILYKLKHNQMGFLHES